MEKCEETEGLNYENMYKKEKDKNVKLQKKVGELSGAVAELSIETIGDKLRIAELECKKTPTFADFVFLGLSVWCGVKLAEKFIKKFM